MAESREYITYPDEQGSINISEEVVAIIASAAAAEVPGVTGLTAPGKDFAEFLGKKPANKGVRILVEDNAITAEVYVTVAAGHTIAEVAAQIQKKTAAAIEAATGSKPKAINIHVTGVTFSRER